MIDRGGGIKRGCGSSNRMYNGRRAYNFASRVIELCFPARARVE